MLTSVLPGIRELRTPLATGYLWLLNVWLFFAERFPHSRPVGGALASIWDVAQYGGKTSQVIALSFVAYLVGAFVEIDPLLLWEHGGRPKWITAIRNQLRRGRLNRIINVYPISQRAQEDLMEFSDEEFDLRGEEQRAAIFRGIAREERQMATRLQAANADLFGRYDRLLSESSFRINLAPPLAVLLSGLIWLSHLPSPWVKAGLELLVLLYCAVLFRQGVLRAIHSRDIIAQAIVVGVVEFRAIKRLRQGNTAHDSFA